MQNKTLSSTPLEWKGGIPQFGEIEPWKERIIEVSPELFDFFQKTMPKHLQADPIPPIKTLYGMRVVVNNELKNYEYNIKEIERRI